jgi:polyhydroxybutyrate depolymerase
MPSCARDDSVDMRSRLHLVVASLAAILLLALPVAAQRGIRGRLGARASARQPSGADVKKITLSYQGMQRHYLLHTPSSASGALVLAFHGGGETPQNQEEISGFDTLADREHFIVAYPEGIGQSWADGRGTTKADRQGVDDVGFAKAMVADIAKTHTVDRRRVFATGPSNGGIFANRLGCDAADTFAAIGPVIGTIATARAASCRPSEPVAVVGVQGVDDPVVPFNGGNVGGTLEGAAAGGSVESSRATQELWRSIAGCAPNPASTVVPALVKDGTSIVRRTYTNCRAGADVLWYEIQGGGHRWPPHHADGIAEAIAKRKLGSSSQNIDASAVIWKFFAAHGRR